MRKKEALAWIIALTLGMTAGCAPGDISRYTARAQQAGEEIFEGKVVPASVGPVKEANVAESGPEETEKTPEETEAATETVNESETTTETAGGAETENSAGETAAEPESAVETKNEEPEGAASENESQQEEEKETEQQETEKLPTMMAQADERVQKALEEKAESFTGKLAGKDELEKTELDALLAVLQQEDYDDRTLCLINSASFEGQESDSFLLFGDSTALTARGKLSGDLWLYAGGKAVKVQEDAEFLGLRTVACGGENFLSVQTKEDGTSDAQLYRIEEGKAQPCFTDAVSIVQAADELLVSYRADCVQYDPVSEEWSGGEEEITYVYAPAGKEFEQLPVRELTAEQYLAYIQPDGTDSESQLWKAQQEERFYNPDEEETEHRYSFFAIGDSWIGYQECRIGLPEDGSSHAVADYRYQIAKLENGKLTAQSETHSGSGYYFEQWDRQTEELEKLAGLPAMYLKNRIDRAAQSLNGKERAALQSVLKVQEYDAEGLCFVQQQDYDGDGEAESFVTIGRYDGILGAPVCDLWFAAQGEATLLEENLPVKSVLSCKGEKAAGGNALFLLEGYEAEGAKDRLYGVREKKPQRYLENAQKIEVEENEDLIAWISREEGKLPYYYHILNGEVVEYGLRESMPERLLQYENGRAVYRSLQKFADLQGGELSCLERENGLIHVMIQDRNGKISHETYDVTGDRLVLTECGDGGYETGAPETADDKAVDTESEDAPETETAAE